MQCVPSEPGEPAVAGLTAGKLVFAVPGQRHNTHAKIVKAVDIPICTVEHAAALHRQKGRHPA